MTHKFIISLAFILGCLFYASIGYTVEISSDMTDDKISVEVIRDNRLFSCFSGIGTTKLTFKDKNNRAVNFKSPPEKTALVRNIQVFTGCRVYHGIFLRIDALSATDRLRDDFNYEDEQYDQLKYIGFTGMIGFDYMPANFISIQIGAGYRNSQFTLYSGSHQNRSKISQHGFVIFTALLMRFSDMFLGIDYFKNADPDGFFSDETGLVFGVTY